MKAKDLVKKERPISELYDSIKQANDRGEFILFVPFNIYVSEPTKLQLISDGFKISLGAFNERDLVIEW